MSETDETSATQTDAGAPPPPGGSKLLLELGPLAVFFGVNAWRGIYWATGAFMVALSVAIGISWWRDRRVPPMTIFTGVLVLVFGGLTLWLQDDRFIKVKVTIVNALFAAILAFGKLTGRNLLNAVLGHAFQLDQAGWSKLTTRYIGFFVALALLNEVLWRSLTTDQWVWFKTVGLIVLMMLFTVFQVPLLQRHQLAGETASVPRNDPPRT